MFGSVVNSQVLPNCGQLLFASTSDIDKTPSILREEYEFVEGKSRWVSWEMKKEREIKLFLRLKFLILLILPMKDKSMATKTILLYCLSLMQPWKSRSRQRLWFQGALFVLHQNPSSLTLYSSHEIDFLFCFVEIDHFFSSGVLRSLFRFVFDPLLVIISLCFEVFFVMFLWFGLMGFDCWLLGISGLDDLKWWICVVFCCWLGLICCFCAVFAGFFW